MVWLSGVCLCVIPLVCAVLDVGGGEAALNQEGEAMTEPDQETTVCLCEKYLHCPECGAYLQDAIGVDYATDTSYDAVKCPQGCNLWPYYT